MSGLARYLQEQFAELAPPGWSVRREVALLSHDLADLLGYDPRADVVLEHANRRLWIEFEVSRADPVANHAKFATAHLFSPLPPSDTFVSMVSPHVARGRRNLAANAVHLLRSIGMSAFQTPLYPHLTPENVKRLNHLPADALNREAPPAAPELERAVTVTDPALVLPDYRLYFVSDILDALLNVRQWNAEVQTPTGAAQWGQRRVRYFVFDPYAKSVSKSFAPTKFCAFTPLPIADAPRTLPGAAVRPPVMTMDIYRRLNGTNALLDGHRAQQHFVQRLAMKPLAPDTSEVSRYFDEWLDRHRDAIASHPAGATILTPPGWFT